MIRTDLAVEAHGLVSAAETLHGVTLKEKEKNSAKITHIKIETEEAAKKMGKPIGNYITIDLPDLTCALPQTFYDIAFVIKEELSSLIEKKDDISALIIGLGNHSITSDSLGPSVAEKLFITRHLFSEIPKEMTASLSSVSAVSPGVLGLTGIETGEIIKGVAEKTSPDVIIAVDALAAGDIKRICRTVQISDTGINPGAGVRNNRKELSKSTLGIPVIAVGVPTVIDAVTITSGVIFSAEKNFSENKENILYPSDIDESEISHFLKSNIDAPLSDFIVTPKDIDLLINKTASLVADGINLALHNKLSYEDIKAYLA